VHLADRSPVASTRILIRVAACLLVVFIVALAIDARKYANINTGDTNNLVAGARFALDCVRDGEFVGCGALEGSVQTQVFPYPLLQYVPATVLIWFGLDDAAVLQGLRWLNVAALVAVVVIVWVALRSRPRLAFLGVAAVLSSSLLYQANASFGEALAAVPAVMAVACAIHRRPYALFLAATVACLGKETMAPFVVVLCLLCAREPGGRWLPDRRLTIGAAAGGLVGYLGGVAFNVFRFGGPRNLLYLDPPLRTDGWARRVEFLVAQWLSPAGGLLWFWPVLTVLLLGVFAIGVTDLRRRDLPAGIPSLTLVLLVVGYTAGLSLWFAPFGWITYGPRLAVPLLPAFTLAALHLAGDRLLSVLDAAAWRGRAAAALLTVASIPLFGAPWRWFDSVLVLISPGRTGCPPMTGLSVYDDPATYYRCTSATMWRVRPQILDESIGFGLSVSGLAWIAGVCSVAILLVTALVRLRPVPEFVDGSLDPDEFAIPPQTTPD
jgi:hypothetical protein